MRSLALRCLALVLAIAWLVGMAGIHIGIPPWLRIVCLAAAHLGGVIVAMRLTMFEPAWEFGVFVVPVICLPILAFRDLRSEEVIKGWIEQWRLNAALRRGDVSRLREHFDELTGEQSEAALDVAEAEGGEEELVAMLVRANRHPGRQVLERLSPEAVLRVAQEAKCQAFCREAWKRLAADARGNAKLSLLLLREWGEPTTEALDLVQQVDDAGAKQLANGAANRAVRCAALWKLGDARGLLIMGLDAAADLKLATRCAYWLRAMPQTHVAVKERSEECSTCNGKGQVYVDKWDDNGYYGCGFCHGTGQCQRTVIVARVGKTERQYDVPRGFRLSGRGAR